MKAGYSTLQALTESDRSAEPLADRLDPEWLAQELIGLVQLTTPHTPAL
jgi:hypothetical protein